MRYIRKFAELISKNKVTQSPTKTTDKKKWVINASSRHLNHIKSNIFAKGFNLSITSKTLLNKDIIDTKEDAVKDLEKEEPDTKLTRIFLCQNKPYT